MKFSMAWAATAAQNVTLKAGIVVLGATTFALTMTSVKLALRPPLVIDRECRTTTAKLAPASDRDISEIEVFVRDAITARFNSDAVTAPGYLSSIEEGARTSEQKELSSRGMVQKVIVNAIKVDGDTVTIDADRLISVGSIRTALAFPLAANLLSTTRTSANPYGLTLTKISPQKPEGAK